MGVREVSIKKSLQVILINVYGPTQTTEKLEVWNEISTFINSMPQETFILGGEFNVVLRKEEKCGGSNPIFRVMEDFKN